LLDVKNPVENPVKTNGNGYTAIGKSQPRVDGPDKVSGHAKFAADLNLPGLLHARPVLSMYAHARIKNINIEEALNVPGVRHVVLADDLPIKNPADSRKRAPLAKNEVFFFGQPVAVVLADTEAAARDGAELVDIDYEPLPVAPNLEIAMRQDAPSVKPKGGHGADEEAKMHNAGAPGDSDEKEQEQLPANISGQMKLKRGDVNIGFGEAAAISDRTYVIPSIHQSYLETQSVTAAPDPMGGITIYTSTQAGFYCRQEVAETLGIALNKVKVVTMTVGGAFGGKFVLYEPLAAALAWLAKRPVRFSLYRMEELAAANPVQEGFIELKMGARADGTICAMKGRVVFDTGVYPGSPYWAAGMLGFTYNIPHFELEAYEVMTNRVNVGAYRAPGAPQVHFAAESAVDDLAQQLKLDPLEMRRKNVVVEGDKNFSERSWPRIGLKECVEALQQHPAYQNRHNKAPGEGVGVAVGGWGGGLEPASALCRMDQDGNFTLSVGISDITGNQTSLRSIAAEILGLPAEKVTVVLGDTDAAPYAGGSGGSKTLYTVGAAVVKAAEDAREQVKRIAATELEANAEDIELKDGKASVKGVPSRSVDLLTIARKSMGFGQRYTPVLGNGSSAITKQAPGFAAHLARVKVDQETGEVEVLEYVAIQDVGFAINPEEVRGQIHGGVVQGLGWALYEQMVYDENGTLVSGSLMDYAIQTAAVVPPIDVQMVEVPAPDGPFGAKGVGEPPIIPGGAAIANAIFDATGARLTQIPATPERVLKAIQSK
jgi:CO/xanthine dehydrogenase Mo-binding subunit